MCRGDNLSTTAIPECISRNNVYECIWDEFEPKKSLGKGAYGEVVEARSRCDSVPGRNNRNIAIKLQPRSDPLSESCFINEVSILKRLVGLPNIVQFIGAGMDDQHYCLLIEHLQGGDLFERIISSTSYSEHDASMLFRSMLETVAAIHSKDICHCDLKPENFVFQSSGDSELKLIDFGTAVLCSRGTRYSGDVGTPLYCAPEILDSRSSHSVDDLKQCDMWSMGILLYVMLTGHLPFSGSSLQEIRSKATLCKFSYPKGLSPSKSAVSLIEALITTSGPRLTADQALKHPWITENQTRTHQTCMELDSMVLVALKNLHTRCKLRTALAKCLESQLSEVDREGIRVMFETIDENKDGLLGVNDMRLFMENQNDSESLSPLLTKDTNERFKENEVRLLHIEGQLITDEVRLVNIFHRLDSDNDGLLSDRDLQMFFPGLCIETKGHKLTLNAFVSLMQGKESTVDVVTPRPFHNLTMPPSFRPRSNSARE